MILVDAEHAGALLLELRESGRTIPDLPDGLRPGTLEEAYAIQDALHLAGGWDIGALKVGCTSAAAQQVLRMTEPVGGRVRAADVYESGVVLAADGFLQPPFFECEFAFRVAADVDSDTPPAAIADPRSLVDAIAAAIELVDSRYDDLFAVSGLSTVADNVANAGLVLGAAGPVTAHTNPAASSIVAYSGEVELARGTGAAVLGDPFLALEWVVGHELAAGRIVRAGTWVTTGTCTGVLPVPLGTPVRVVVEGLGEVQFVVENA